MDRPRRLKPGTQLLREYQGERHTVTVVANGYVWHETTYASLSTIARAIRAAREEHRWRMKITDARLYGAYLVFRFDWGAPPTPSACPQRKLVLRTLPV
jgi:Protein of unknown function (DUF2924)